MNNSSGPEIFKCFIGKKRENKQKYIGIKNVGEKLANENILYCLKCAWKFPDEMSKQRRNIHVYKCFEGKGDKDIIEYNEEQKFKIIKNSQDEQIIGLLNCPKCRKNIKKEDSKGKQFHLYECSNKCNK